MSSATGIPLTAMDHGDPDPFGELLRAVQSVSTTGRFKGAAAIEDFEHEYARWCEVRHVVGVSSGTEALILALRAINVGPGDEVVVPANSFIVTAEAVSRVGAVPRFADVDPETQLMTALTMESAITPAVRCVIPVHLYGRTVEMNPIVELATDRGIRVIEDAAQAQGARYEGKRVGTIGDLGTFAFSPTKNLGAWNGGGGVVVAFDSDIAERVRRLRSHREHSRQCQGMMAASGRLDTIQAAILRQKLGHLETWNDMRRQAADTLRIALLESDLGLPVAPGKGCDHVFHQFVVRTPERDALKDFLAQNGIATGIHYPIPIHRSRAYRAVAGERDVAPVASRLANEILSLPMFPGMASEQIQRIADAVFRFAGHGVQSTVLPGG
jgi:dTDP-3-amino-3,4,6-trideoxy-alpha-D-glucose transaminase